MLTLASGGGFEATRRNCSGTYVIQSSGLGHASRQFWEYIQLFLRCILLTRPIRTLRASRARVPLADNDRRVGKVAVEPMGLRSWVGLVRRLQLRPGVGAGALQTKTGIFRFEVQ